MTDAQLAQMEAQVVTHGLFCLCSKELRDTTFALTAKVRQLYALISCCCQCRWETVAGRKQQVAECHFHQCQRSVLFPNGDPSAVTLEEEIERLRSLTQGLADRVAAQSEVLSRKAEKETRG